MTVRPLAPVLPPGPPPSPVPTPVVGPPVTEPVRERAPTVEEAVKEVQQAAPGGPTAKVFQEQFLPSLREAGAGSYITPFGTFEVSQAGEVLRVSSVSGPSPVAVIKVSPEVAAEIRPEILEVGRAIREAAVPTVAEIERLGPPTRVAGLFLEREPRGLVFAPRLEPLPVEVVARTLPSPGTREFAQLSLGEQEGILGAVTSLEGQLLPGFRLGDLSIDEAGMVTSRQVAINPINLGTSISVADATIKDLGLATDQYFFYQDPETSQFQIVGATGVTQTQVNKIVGSYTEVPLGLPDVAPAEAIGTWLFTEGYLEKTGEKKWDPQKEKLVDIYDLSVKGIDKIKYSADPETGVTTLLVRDTTKSRKEIGEEINKNIIAIINEESAIEAAREQIKQEDLLLAEKGPLLRIKGPLFGAPAIKLEPTEKGRAFYLAYVAPRVTSLKDPLGIRTVGVAGAAALESSPFQVQSKDELRTRENPLGLTVVYEPERTEGAQLRIAERITKVNLRAREEMIIRARRTDLPGFVLTSPAVQISGLLAGATIAGVGLGAVSVPAEEALITAGAGVGYKAALAGKVLAAGEILAKPAVAKTIFGAAVAAREAPKLMQIYQGADPEVVLTDVAFDVAKVGAVGVGFKAGFPIGREIGEVAFPRTIQFMGITRAGEVTVGPEVPLGRAELVRGPMAGEVVRGVARFPTFVGPTGEVIAGQFVSPEAFLGGPTTFKQVTDILFERPGPPELGFAYRESLRPGERFVITGDTSDPKFVEPFEPRAGTRFRITYLTKEGVPYYSEQTGVRTIVKGGSIVTATGREATIERMVQTPTGAADLEPVRFSTRMKMNFLDDKTMAAFKAGDLDVSKLRFSKEVGGNIEITRFFDEQGRTVMSMTRTIYPTPSEIKGALGSRLVTPVTSLEGVEVSGETYKIPGIGTEKLVLTDPAFENMFQKYPELLQRLGDTPVILTDAGKVSVGENILTQLEQARLAGEGVILREVGIERFVERERDVVEISKEITKSLRAAGLPPGVAPEGPRPDVFRFLTGEGVPFVEGAEGELVRAPSVAPAGVPGEVVTAPIFGPTGVEISPGVAARLEGVSTAELLRFGFAPGDAFRYLSMPTSDMLSLVSPAVAASLITPALGIEALVTPEVGIIPRVAPIVATELVPSLAAEVIPEVVTIPEVVPITAPAISVGLAVEPVLEPALEPVLAPMVTPALVPGIAPTPVVGVPPAIVVLPKRPRVRKKRLREVPFRGGLALGLRKGKAVITPDLFTAAVSQAAFGKATKPRFKKKDIELLKARGLIRVPTKEFKEAGVPSSKKVLRELIG